MSGPLSEETLAAIRADLAAVPAPPWRWIGVRGCGGPQLVTDHSGRQYLLRAAKPADVRGDEVLDPHTDCAVYGDLEFRDQRDGERYSSMRPGDQLATGRTDYDPDSIVGVDNPVARWVERSAAHASALLAEVDRLRAWVQQLEQALAATGRSLSSLIFYETDPGVEALGAQWLYHQVMPQADDPFAQPRAFRASVLEEAAKAAEKVDNPTDQAHRERPQLYIDGYSDGVQDVAERLNHLADEVAEGGGRP